MIVEDEFLDDDNHEFHCRDATTLLIDIGNGRCEALNRLDEEWESFCTAVSLCLPNLQRLELRSVEQGVFMDRPSEVLKDEKLNHQQQQPSFPQLVIVKPMIIPPSIQSQLEYMP